MKMRHALLAASFALFTIPCVAADLTGNWAVKDPLPDGTFRFTYLNLKQEGSQITGTIRTSQFYFKILESTSTAPDSFTLSAGMPDGHSDRRATYEVKLVGDELHVTTHRGRNNELVEMVAHRAPDGEGA